MTDPELAKRIERLEDAQAFGDRAAEQFSEQLIEVFERIDALDRRLQGLETRLRALDDEDHAAESEPAEPG